jgi:hypothetical protein
LDEDEKNSIRLIPATEYEVVSDPHEDYVSEIIEGQRRRFELLSSNLGDDFCVESNYFYGSRITTHQIMHGGITSTLGDTSAFKKGTTFKNEKDMSDAVNKLCPNYFLMHRENKRKTGENNGEYSKYTFDCKHAGKPRAWVKGQSSKIDCPAMFRFWKGALDSVFMCTKFEELHNHPIKAPDATKIRCGCVCNIHSNMQCIYKYVYNILIIIVRDL